MVLTSLWLVWQLSCSGPAAIQPDPGPGSDDRAAGELGPADRVGAVDLDGDGFDEVVLVADGVATWEGRVAELGGDVQVVRRADPDGDGRQVLLLGTGMSRRDRQAPTRVWAIGPDGAELLLERRSVRNQVADLRVVGGRVWAALFGVDKAVEAGWIVDGALEVIDTRDLAAAWLPLPDGRRIIGRVYGDQPKAPGDLRIVGPDRERILPTLRGVRSLTAADLDGDGHDELLVGDGWHHSYGRQALARVRLLEGPDWKAGRTIAMFDGDYTVWSTEVIGGRILATSTSAVHLLERDPLGWSDREVAPMAEVGNAVAYRDVTGWWALVSGRPARLVPLPDAAAGR